MSAACCILNTGYSRPLCLTLTLQATLIIVLASITAGEANGQSASLGGFITDQSTGRPLELVSVALRDEHGGIRGAATNRDGLYQITRIVPGRYVVEASFIGYETYRNTLIFRAGENRTLNIALSPGAGELDAIVVESERTSGAARITAGQQTIRPAEIEQIPTPDVSGDLASYLITLPGVVSTGDRGGQLFVRGGEPSQNLVLLDGILLYQPFHIVGFYSAFPSEILSRVDMYAGGYTSRFGGRLSSVIDVTSRNGNTRKPAGSVAISPFIGSAVVEGPILNDEISILLSARRSMLEWGADRYVPQALPFVFGDFFGKLHSAVTYNSRFSITGLRTFDRGILRPEAVDEPAEEVRWENDAIGMRYIVLPETFPVLADFRLSYSRLQTDLGPPGEPIRMSRIHNTYMGIESTHTTERLEVEAGSTLRISKLHSEVGGLFQNWDFRLSTVAHWGSYLDFNIDAGRGFWIRPGLRAQFYRVRFEPFLEPRLRVVWNRRGHQISAAAGMYHQEIVGLNDRRDAASVFTVWTNIPKLEHGVEDIGQTQPQRAFDAILGYRGNPTYWLEFAVEGFYRRMTSLYIAEWTAFPRFTTRLQPATGNAKGIETRVEIRRSPFYAYANYGLSSTTYFAMQPSLMIWYGGEKLRFRPPHDRRHQVNVVASTQLAGFGISARWEFGSGLPFSQAIAFDGYALIEDIVRVSDVPTSRRVIYEHPFNAELPAYHRLDVSVDRAFPVRHATLTLQASAMNVYNRRNLFYLDVFTLRRVDQLPFVPSLGLRLSFD